MGINCELLLFVRNYGFSKGLQVPKGFEAECPSMQSEPNIFLFGLHGSLTVVVRGSHSGASTKSVRYIERNLRQ